MNETGMVRRLTTIVALDTVGFSTMSARNEEHALALLAARMTIAETYIAQHRGRVFKMTGDGLLAEFASPVEAVRAAIEIQEAMRTANAQAAPADRMELRIGANLGDVVESGDDLVGDAVNVAVRLESIALPGGICVASAVYDQILGKLTLGAEDMGPQQVKNIPRAIHAYRLTAEGSVRPRPKARRRRLLLAAGVTVAAALAAVGGAFLLRDLGGPTPPRAAEAPAVTAPAFFLADVPFVPSQRRRELEFYERADGAKAMAISLRGIAEVATRRIDEKTARSAALEACNATMRKLVRPLRDYDGCMIYAFGSTVVWSFRQPAMPPQPYLPGTRPTPAIPLVAATAPLIGEALRKGLAEVYPKLIGNRAVAIGRNGTDWWASSDSEFEVVRRALQACGHLSGRPCFIYAIGDQVIVQTPQKFRIVDVFTPQEIAGLDARQQEAVERYLVADDWRAVAVGHNGRVGLAAGRSSEDAAVEAALRECVRAGGLDCAVSAIGPYLVTRK